MGQAKARMADRLPDRRGQTLLFLSMSLMISLKHDCLVGIQHDGAWFHDRTEYIRKVTEKQNYLIYISILPYYVLFYSFTIEHRPTEYNNCFMLKVCY